MAETRGVFSLKTAVKIKKADNWVSLSDVWIAPSPAGPTPNTGYFGGGFPTVATMDKLTYSSDSTAVVPGAALSIARYGLAATGSSSAGYFGGGFSTISTMDKVTYSSDTTAAVPGAI